MKPQGAVANFTGAHEEKGALYYLETLNYKPVNEAAQKAARRWVTSGRDIADWCRNHDADSLYLYRQPTIRNIFERPWKIDLTIWHRTMWPHCLFIEIKTQSVSGSCEEKLPHAVLSLKQQNRPAGLLIIGSGFTHDAIAWVESQQTEKFIMWRHTSKMREYIETGKISFSKSSVRSVTTAQAELFGIQG